MFFTVDYIFLKIKKRVIVTEPNGSLVNEALHFWSQLMTRGSL